MRKALLALSEKRKVALMKTKKDLELKLKNNVDVEQMIAGKKKLKRNTFLDRTSLPLKCFDLSSSGGEESSASRDTSDSAATAPAATTLAEASPVSTAPVAMTATPTSAEKSIQTSDSISGMNLMECSTNTADENFIVVDGSYLNILFHNLTLPQIFSGYKQYEVNEEALKTIVDSTNSRHTENWSDVLEKLMNQTKNEEEDKTSTPSTARSLVEEFEQYYKTLAEEDQSPESVGGWRSPTKVYEGSDATAQTSTCTMQVDNGELLVCLETMTMEAVKDVKVTEDELCQCEPCEEATTSLPGLTGPLPAPVGTLPSPAPAGPLPVPKGAASLLDSASLDDMCLTPKSSDASFAGKKLTKFRYSVLRLPVIG